MTKTGILQTDNLMFFPEHYRFFTLYSEITINFEYILGMFSRKLAIFTKFTKSTVKVATNCENK